jgi:hypothetical protein
MMLALHLTVALPSLQPPWQPTFPLPKQACMDGGELLLRVAWVGYDLPSWIDSSELNAHPDEYDFLSDELRTWVGLRYDALQKHNQRKRRQEQQQQQQQQQQQRRVTRSRSTADAGSSASSSASSSTGSHTDPLLADGYGP